jgi:trk system potassium uptake protein TrkA
LTHLFTLGDSGLEIVEVKIPPESKTVGKSVKELPLPEESKLVLVIPRERKPHLATASTILQAGDRVIALTPPESEEQLRTALRGS